MSLLRINIERESATTASRPEEHAAASQVKNPWPNGPWSFPALSKRRPPMAPSFTRARFHTRGPRDGSQSIHP